MRDRIRVPWYESYRSRTLPKLIAWAALIALCAGLAYAGCGRRPHGPSSAPTTPTASTVPGQGQERVPPFKLQEEHVYVPPGSPPPPLAEVVITKPKKGAVFRCGDMIDCEVQLTIPEGAQMPDVVYFQIKDRRGVQWSPADATPAAKGTDGRYLLKGRPKAPDEAGRGPCLLYAWVDYHRVIEGAPIEKNMEIFKASSPSIPIEVRR